MDASDWIAVVAVVVALAGLVVTVIATHIARESKKVSEQAAEASHKSAEEAVAITRIEAERRGEERERWHHELGATSPPEIVAELREGPPTATVFGSITVPRGYRVKADAYFRTGGSTEISMSSPLHPNQRREFQIEQWPPGSTQLKTKEIRFRFWPPLASDGVDVWTCPCGRPTGESLDDNGHWQWTVPVVMGFAIVTGSTQ